MKQFEMSKSVDAMNSNEVDIGEGNDKELQVTLNQRESKVNDEVPVELLIRPQDKFGVFKQYMM